MADAKNPGAVSRPGHEKTDLGEPEIGAHFVSFNFLNTLFGRFVQVKNETRRVSHAVETSTAVMTSTAVIGYQG
jgi:hypothetical protein